MEPEPQIGKSSLRPLTWLGRFFGHPVAWLLGYRDMPLMSRPTFRVDFQSFLMWSCIVAVARPGITQAILKKDMHASHLLAALPYAAAVAPNLLSVGWAWVAGGSNLVRFILIPSTLAGLAAICVALVPATQPILFTALIVLVFVAMSGVVTLRTAVWRRNYPRGGVGNIISRFTVVAMLLAAVSSALVATLLDHWSWIYRVLFPLVGVVVILAGVLYQRTRMRGLALNNTPRVRGSPLAGWRILRRDRPYRQFIGFQMIFGSANMMTEAILVLFLASDFQASYLLIAVLMVLLPMTVNGLTIPLAGRLMDRTNPMRVRTYGASAWAVSRLFLFAAALSVASPQAAMCLLAGSRLFCGLGMGFGRIAFQVGHLHFAPKDLVEHYMGLHLSAVGLRGLVAPFVGIALWTGLAMPDWLGGWSIPALNEYIFLVAFVMQLISVIGFAWMDHRYKDLQPLGAEAQV